MKEKKNVVNPVTVPTQIGEDFWGKIGEKPVIKKLELLNN